MHTPCGRLCCGIQLLITLVEHSHVPQTSLWIELCIIQSPLCSAQVSAACASAHAAYMCGIHMVPQGVFASLLSHAPLWGAGLISSASSSAKLRRFLGAMLRRQSPTTVDPDEHTARS